MVLVKKTFNTLDTFYDPKCGVFAFLEEIGLSQYYEMFLAKGFDSERDLRFMERKDLDTLHITDEEHRRLIISQASLHRPSEEQELYEWLRENMLEYYCINFLQSGRDSLHVVRQMVLPDEDIYDDLEIMLPAHRKRLERAVSRLQKQSQTSNNEVEYPVAYGKWMKPDYLEYAKFDFLCVDATIFSTENNNTQEEVVFMVDSGSDVVTLRPELVQRLNLVKKCTVRSQGVHVAKEKTLYEAKLKIGSVELKIELIPEEYNSLGNRVLRHFRHYITGSRHVWLKGDFKDPSMEITSSQQGYEKRKKLVEQRDREDSAIVNTEPEVLPESSYHEIAVSESNLESANQHLSSEDVGKKKDEMQNDVEIETLDRVEVDGLGEECKVNQEEYTVESARIEERNENRVENIDNIQNGDSGRVKVGGMKQKLERTDEIQSDESDRLKIKEGSVGLKANLPLQKDKVFLQRKNTTANHCYFQKKRSRGTITSHLNNKRARRNEQMST